MEEIDSEDDPKAAQLANSRANYRMRLAESYDRRQFGAPRDQVNVQVNLPSLHLDALRRRAVTATTRPQLSAASEPDVEVIEGV